jgi:hypothetical protein
LLGWEPRETLSGMLPGIVSDYVARYAADIANAPPARRASSA